MIQAGSYPSYIGVARTPPSIPVTGIISETDAISRIRDLVTLLTPKFVERTAANYKSQVRTAVNDVERRCRAEALHPLAPSFVDYLGYEEQLRLGAGPQLTTNLIHLAGDAAVLHAYRHIWDDGPRGAKSRRLIQRLKSPSDVDHCLYEFRIAKHFELQGADVTLRSALGLPGHDLEVCGNGVTAEVECKHIYPWAGRRIHNPGFNRLFASLVARFNAPALPAVAVTVECQDRLEHADHQTIIDTAVRLALSGQPRDTVGRYAVTVNVLGPKPHTLQTASFGAHVEALFRDKPHAHIGFGSNNRGEKTDLWVVLSCWSRRPDDVVGHFVKVLRRAAHQLSGTRPGLVAVHMPGITLPQEEAASNWRISQKFADTAERGFLDKVCQVMFTLDEPKIAVVDEVVYGGPLIGIRNRRAAHSLPEGFPGLG